MPGGRSKWGAVQSSTTRHGRLPEVEANKPKQPFKTYPIGYFHIDIAEVRTDEAKLYRS